MKFYYVNIDYLNELNKLDNKVYVKGDRPYIGIVLKINGLNFLAPLSSPKPKHARLKKPTVYKMFTTHPLGIINLNNMIPVPTEELQLLNMKDIKSTDKKYYYLLLEQINFIKSEQNDIKRCAEEVYYKAKSGHYIATHCVDFQKLEDNIKEK